MTRQDVFRTIGWLVVCFPDQKRNPDWCEPLALGLPNEPSPDMLLRRQRFMAFESEDEADAALRQTRQKAIEQKCPWIWTFRFDILPIEMHVSDGKPF